MTTELDKAREAAISTFKNKYPRVIGDAPYAPQVVNAFEEGFDAGYNYDPPADPEFDKMLSGAIEKVNDVYRREGYQAGLATATCELSGE